MNTIKTFTLIILLITVSICKAMPTDTLKEVGEKVNGKKTGLWKYYKKDGSLSYQCNYADDALNGNYKSYYKDNKLSLEGNYQAGKELGIEGKL